MLAAASLIFCALAGWLSLLFLTGSLIANFWIVGWIGKMRAGTSARRLTVAAAIAANLLPLLAFRLVRHWGLLGSGGVAVPIGLGFYTLQQITYLIDSQRADTPRLNFIRYVAYMSFFGQLPAGPIASFARMAPQIVRLGVERVHWLTIARGLTLVLAGTIKKVWLADYLARNVDAVFLGATVGDVTPLEAWTAAWGFLMQLYFDFSGYSDVAIGLGLCFGLVLPINFNSPLKAATPGQYVMRWHISLMMFVRDYVFQPLFSIARRLPIQPTSRRYTTAWALATLGAYFAVAAWHTLAPLALAQGLCVAAAVVGLQLLRQRTHRPRRPEPTVFSTVRQVTGRVLLLLAASVAAIFLRASGDLRFMPIFAALFDVSEVSSLLYNGGLYIVSFFGAAPDLQGIILFPNARIPGFQTLAQLALMSMIVLAAPNTMQIFGLIEAPQLSRSVRWRPSLLWGFATFVLLVLAVVGTTQSVQRYAFLYAKY